MKKIISVFMSSALLLGLVGCNSANTNQQGITNPTNQNTEVALTETPISETETTAPQYQVYSLSGMSGEEISNLIISLSTGISTGDTMDNYADRFTVKPCPPPYSFSSNDFYYAFWGSESVNYGIETSKPSVTDYIDGVSVSIQQEMDGTVTVNDYNFVEVYFVLSDYNTAADVYDHLYQYLCSNLDGGKDFQPTDNRTGTHWSSVVPQVTDYGRMDFYLEMYQVDNGYGIRVQLPILP